jgi:hypothetical protein
MKRPTKLVTATQAEIDQLLSTAKKALPEQQYQLLARELGAFMVMQESLRNGKMTPKQVRKAVFAARAGGKPDAPEDPGATLAQDDDKDDPTQAGVPTTP